MQSLRHQRVKRHLGLFKDAEAAARRYDTEAQRLFGPFAKTNFPTATSGAA